MMPGEYNAHLCNLRGENEFALGRFQDAALSYSTVAISEPGNADAQYNLAICLYRADRWDAAVAAFQRVLRLDPHRREARLALGACLLHLNRAEEALACFFASFNDQRALFGRAVALHMLGRFDEAGRAYESILELNPHAEEVLCNLIAMDVEAQDMERVRDHCSRLLEICPDSAVALQGLATAALDSGDNRVAASYCDRILEVAPDCLEAWHNLRIAMDRPSFRFSEPAFAAHSGGKR